MTDVRKTDVRINAVKASFRISERERHLEPVLPPPYDGGVQLLAQGLDSRVEI